jgi:hypothetical protein
MVKMNERNGSRLFFKESDMATTHRLSTTGVLIVCFLGTQLSGTLFARDKQPSPSPESSSQSAVKGTSEAPGQALADPAAAVSADEQGASAAASSPSAEERFRFTLNNDMFTPDRRVGSTPAQSWRNTVTFVPVAPDLAQRGGYYGRGRGHHGAVVAIALGAVASIAGGAILVYANRPNCSANPTPGGCGYGTKVVGGAVLSAGIVGIVVGALTWR